GAMKALLQIPEDHRKRGVVAFSSGNHAQGVALASKLLGIRATIVMPEGSVATKVEATKAYGAEVVMSGVTAATRDTVAREIAEKTGASVIPPFDDERIIAGRTRTLAVGARNFAIMRERVRDVVSVEDDALLDAVKFAMYRTKMVIEPTGALGIAALLTRTIKPSGPIAVIVSGGNLDFS